VDGLSSSIATVVEELRVARSDGYTYLDIDGPDHSCCKLSREPYYLKAEAEEARTSTFTFDPCVDGWCTAASPRRRSQIEMESMARRRRQVSYRRQKVAAWTHPKYNKPRDEERGRAARSAGGTRKRGKRAVQTLFCCSSELVKTSPLGRFTRDDWVRRKVGGRCAVRRFRPLEQDPDFPYHQYPLPPEITVSCRSETGDRRFPRSLARNSMPRKLVSK